MFDREEEPKLFKGMFSALLFEAIGIMAIIGLAKIALVLVQILF